jgi:methylenetetrahydrofolate dehydrogenase (NADP+)/methenyltetrahydrofolate cyclohydrolase
MQLLDGKRQKIFKAEIATEVKNDEWRESTASCSRNCGNDGASLTHVGSKVKACERVGLNRPSKMPSRRLKQNCSRRSKELNENDDIDGFIHHHPVQIDEQKILMAVDPGKDVDGFHPENFGKMALDMTTFIPATPFEFWLLEPMD